MGLDNVADVRYMSSDNLHPPSGEIGNTPYNVTVDGKPCLAVADVLGPETYLIAFLTDKTTELPWDVDVLCKTYIYYAWSTKVADTVSRFPREEMVDGVPCLDFTVLQAVIEHQSVSGPLHEYVARALHRMAVMHFDPRFHANAHALPDLPTRIVVKKQLPVEWTIAMDTCQASGLPIATLFHTPPPGLALYTFTRGPCSDPDDHMWTFPREERLKKLVFKASMSDAMCWQGRDMPITFSTVCMGIVTSVRRKGAGESFQLPGADPPRSLGYILTSESQVMATLIMYTEIQHNV